MLSGIRPERISYWLFSSSSLSSSGSKTFSRFVKVSIMVCWIPAPAAPMFHMSIIPVDSIVVDGFTCIRSPWSVR